MPHYSQKWDEAVTKIVGLLVLGSLLTAPVAIAKEGEAANEATTQQEELLAIENQNVKVLLEGGRAAADWLARLLVNDVAYTNENGEVVPKPRILDEFRSGSLKVRSTRHFDYRVTVYGNTAVVSYHSDDVIDRKGKITTGPALCVDVFVKQNERWRIADHQATPVSW